MISLCYKNIGSMPAFLRKIAICFVLCALSASIPFASPAYGAEETEEGGGSFFGAVGDSIANAWTKGTLDVYVPAYTWHNRFMYDRNPAKKYNEYPWGLGLGKSYFDNKGNQHALMAMGFMDSNEHFQPVVAYSHFWYWEMVKDLSFGLGVAAGFSARHEWGYVPFPAILPLVSLQYKKLAVMATYLPDARNNGNVLFVLLRWHFD